LAACCLEVTTAGLDPALLPPTSPPPIPIPIPVPVPGGGRTLVAPPTALPLAANSTTPATASAPGALIIRWFPEDDDEDEEDEEVSGAVTPDLGLVVRIRWFLGQFFTSHPRQNQLAQSESTTLRGG